MQTRMARSRTYPCEPSDAFDAVLPLPLDRLFSRRFGVIPPIRGTVQDGVWGEVGQRRTVDLTGPGTMAETLVEVSRPTHFGYVLDEIRGPFAALASRIEGRWEFAEAGTGVRVTWTWTVVSRRGSRYLMPLFATQWQGYARQALEELEPHLVVS